MRKIVSVLLITMLIGTQLVTAHQKLSGGDPVQTYTFEELTNISAENVEKISIACSKDGRTEFSTSSPLVMRNIVDSFKDMQFKRDITAGGSAGGWLYFINFYMTDGTYIQYGTRLYIDKINYISLEHNTAIERMAYFHDLFKDIDCNEWATDYILECKELGFLEDIEDIQYKEPITRGKFCEILFNMHSKSIDSPKTWNINMKQIFEDCNNEKVAILYLEEIINGKGDKVFAPDDYLTREEAATILVRYVNKFKPIPVTEMYFDYDDMSEVSSWASDSVQIVSNLGVMTGVGDNKFAPQDTYTAEQAIATIVRLCDKK